jgi:hypothetical protein
VDRAVAGSRWKGRWWKADIEWRTDLLPPGKDGKQLSVELYPSS